MSEQETRLSVGGMTCRSCVVHVDRALREVEGVTHVDVRLREGAVLVRHDGRRAALEEMIAALREAGYEGAPST